MAKVRSGAAAEAAADFLEGGVQAAEGGHGRQQDVGVGEKREGKQGAGESVDGGQFGYTEHRFQSPLHKAAGSEGGAGDEGVDEAGDDEGQDHDDGPYAAAWKVGAGQQPGDGYGQRGGDDRDRDDE